MPSNAVISAPAFGGAKYQALQDYNYTTVQGLHGGVGTMFPGGVFSLFGALFKVVQNRSGGDLVQGDVTSVFFNDASRIGGIATGVTPAVILTDDTHTTGDGSITGDQSFPSEITVTAGAMATTANQQRRAILANTPAAGASTVRVAKAHPEDGPGGTDITSVDIFTGTPDNTWKYSVLCPWEVVKADTGALVSSLVDGVVVSSTITNNNFGIAQISGLAMAKVDGTVDLVAGDLLIAGTGGTVGAGIKWVVTNIDPTIAQVNQAAYVFARVFDAYTADSIGVRQVQLRPGWALFPYPTF
jgi:hypothetical protein